MNDEAKKTRCSTRFVIQKHHARTLHYDLRLQMSSILKSWAVPKGPPKKIGEKHLAILTEDHPLSYAKFEGVIPEGHYGAGKVEIWDSGYYRNLKKESMARCFKEGVIEFELKGDRLKGRYAIIHFKEKNWLFTKLRMKR
jgi:DNA ligase D-like protein (predicted 3'-phosphoesterase)